MALKIYYWIFTILNILGIIYFLTQHFPLKGGDMLSIILTAILIMGTYTYVYKRKSIKRKMWTYVFWFVLIILMLDMIELFFNPHFLSETFISYFWDTSIKISNIDMFISWIISIPALYALYKLT